MEPINKSDKSRYIFFLFNQRIPSEYVIFMKLSLENICFANTGLFIYLRNIDK